MKSLVLLCFALLITLISLPAYSQTVGIKAGLNYSMPQARPALKGQDNIIGYNIGGAYSFYIYDFFYIQPELLLSQKGYKFTDRQGFAVKRTFGHIEIPVFLKFVYRAGRQSDTEFYGAFGPSLSYALFGRESTDDYTSYHEIVFLDNFNRFEISGVGGIGIARSAGPGFLTI